MALLFLAVTVGSTVAAVRIARARDDANQSAFEARQSAEQEREARAEAEKARQQAEIQRARAEEGFRQARQAVDEYFTLVNRNPALAAAQFEPLRKQLLESALRYHERFVREHGNDPEVRAELAASHFRVGVINQLIGLDPLPAKKRGLAVFKQLVEENVPLNQFGSLRDGIFPTGRNNPVAKNRSEMFSTSAETARLFEILIARYPDELGFRNDLAITYSVMGIVHRWAGHFHSALRHHERGEKILAQLVAKDSASPDHLYLHSNGLLQKARTIQALGRPDDAERAFGEAIATFNRIPTSYSRWQDSQYNLACTRRDLAYLVWKSPQRREEAEAGLRQALETFDDLTASFPEIPVFRFDAAVNHDALAQMLERAGRMPGAEAEYRTALDGLEKLVLDFPDQAGFEKRLRLTFDGLTYLVGKQGRAQDRAQLIERQASIDERRSRATPTRTSHGPQEPNDTAWFLATCGDSQFQDPQRAVEMAKRTVQIEPDNPSHWNTLGIAQYRAGDWREAVAALDKSVAINSGGDAFDWFFLAMAYFKMGERRRSHECFEQAAAWIQKHRPTDEQLSRIQAEAATLLGVAETESTE